MAAMGGSGSADAAASSGSARRRRQQRQRQLSRHVTWLSGLLQCKSHHTGGGGGGSGQCPGCCALSKRISSLEAALERHAVPRQEGERASGIEAPEATPSGLAAPTAEVPPGELPRDLHEQGDGERTQDIDPGELSKSKPHEEAHKFIIEEVCEPTSERASDIEASEATPSGLAVTTAEVSPGELHRDLHEHGNGEHTNDIDPGVLSKTKPHEEAHKVTDEVCEPTSDIMAPFVESHTGELAQASHRAVTEAEDVNPQVEAAALPASVREANSAIFERTLQAQMPRSLAELSDMTVIDAAAPQPEVFQGKASIPSKRKGNRQSASHREIIQTHMAEVRGTAAGKRPG